MTCVLKPSMAGEGGMLGVTRNTDQWGLFVEGNTGGTGSASVYILGDDREAIFDMSQSGDGSVWLPARVGVGLGDFGRAGRGELRQPVRRPAYGVDLDRRVPEHNDSRGRVHSRHRLEQRWDLTTRTGSRATR